MTAPPRLHQLHWMVTSAHCVAWGASVPDKVLCRCRSSLAACTQLSSHRLATERRLLPVPGVQSDSGSAGEEHFRWQAGGVRAVDAGGRGRDFVWNEYRTGRHALASCRAEAGQGGRQDPAPDRAAESNGMYVICTLANAHSAAQCNTGKHAHAQSVLAHPVCLSWWYCARMYTRTQD